MDFPGTQNLTPYTQYIYRFQFIYIIMLMVLYIYESRRGCQKEEGEDMELKNLKLYLENQSIVEENEKLRKKANLLHQENLALMSEFEKKFPHLDRFSTTLSLLHNKH